MMEDEIIEVADTQRGKRRKDVESGTCFGEDVNGSVPGNPSETEVISKIHNVNDKPYVGMEFKSHEAAKCFYDAYAMNVGFGTRVGKYNRSKPDGPIVSWNFACYREVSKRKNVESCNAMLQIDRNDCGSWVVTKFVEDHNHSTVSPTQVHYLRPRRHFAGASMNAAECMTISSDILASADGNHVYKNINQVAKSGSPVEINSPQNCNPVIPANLNQPCARRTLGRDAHNLLDYFKTMQAENPGFYYAIQLDDENRMINVFWADARSRTSYTHFGDAVTFDTMYRPNQFLVPFAPFTGVNHHGQIVLFGCALIFDESEASFTWVLKTWLSAMNNRPPISITTDQDRAIKAAVNQVLPESRHCICKWHILREGRERLSHVYVAHPSLYAKLYSCINFSETIDDFESSWCSLLEKYDLQKNEWLQAVYNARKQWAPVYFRDTFFAELSSEHRLISFFDGYVNQQTNLPMFFKQYERALEDSLDRELKSDLDTIVSKPETKTPSPMEQQAANLYTKKIFAKFQEELVETFVYTANNVDGDGIVSKFRVAKYEQDDKAYIVMFNSVDMKVKCSCQMFEYSGILCRHILTVFTVTNTLTLPAHYIMKRWTKNAKEALRSDDECLDLPDVESLTSRFNTLCREALKYAEEGAIATETYIAAISALRDGVKKIEAVKQNLAKAGHFLESVGYIQEENNKKTPVQFPDMPSPSWPWQEPWQDAVPHQINLNDLGIPIAGFNQPSSLPLSLSRESLLADGTVVRSCFKSMTWVIEHKDSSNKVAVIKMKLQEHGNIPSGETDVQFRLTKVTLEPMLKSMTYISQQLSAPARVAVMNLKLQDSTTTTGENEVKFQVSRDTLTSMLRSMAYIREQL
ncbi:OLC1v1001129C3 [Oldenlandia corymbosa var. corymbosa]|uniref:Protein FAR1-RELATED SEQUENCE n=1 Tax=Oldenlandia corymbosa var. corymbosa TaxID=529605 RepID=A0AAV1D4M1_OLDCO|nr:OLC1v1001129C3 [Oldenlandia corymbosa var. corymbosa]